MTLPPMNLQECLRALSRHEHSDFTVGEEAADELDRLHARVAELEAVIDQSARVMHGEGVSDQGEAWDQCLRILDTARKAKP